MLLGWWERGTGVEVGGGGQVVGNSGNTVVNAGQVGGAGSEMIGVSTQQGEKAGKEKCENRNCLTFWQCCSTNIIVPGNREGQPQFPLWRVQMNYQPSPVIIPLFNVNRLYNFLNHKLTSSKMISILHNQSSGSCSACSSCALWSPCSQSAWNSLPRQHLSIPSTNECSPLNQQVGYSTLSILSSLWGSFSTGGPPLFTLINTSLSSGIVPSAC